MKLDGTQIKKLVQQTAVNLLIFIRKGMVMSGINYIRTGIKFVALFVEKRLVFVHDRMVRHD